MSDLASYEGFRDLLVGVLVGAVTGLVALVRKLDVGEINRRLEKLEEAVDRLRDKSQKEE